MQISDLYRYQVNWIKLVQMIQAAAPSSTSRLLLDLLDDPDSLGATWGFNYASDAQVSSQLENYYLTVMQLIQNSCSDCMFMVQGAGQSSIIPLS